jgi:hypothetical protein
VRYAHDFDGVTVDPVHDDVGKRREYEFAGAGDPSYATAIGKKL